jgi:preprotein translocase subunit SecF
LKFVTAAKECIMKKVKIWMLLLLVAITALSVFCFTWFAMIIDLDFASEVLLEYHYADKNIAVKITDKNDILTLKQILSGRPFKDSAACSFATNISITITNGNKSVVFYPACDGCPLLLVNDSGKYIIISYEARKRLNEILEKYDMTFPCIAFIHTLSSSQGNRTNGASGSPHLTISNLTL